MNLDLPEEFYFKEVVDTKVNLKQDNLIDGGFDSILSSFRLGRLRAGGAKGPGLFFILPCIDRWATINVDYTECLLFTGPPLQSLSM